MSDTLRVIEDQTLSLFGHEFTAGEAERVVKVTKAAIAKAQKAGKPEPTDRTVTLITPVFNTVEDVTNFFGGMFVAAEAKKEGNGHTVILSHFRSSLEEATEAMYKNQGKDSAYADNLIAPEDEKGETLSKVAKRLIEVGAEMKDLQQLKEAKGWGPNTPYQDEGAVAIALTSKIELFSNLYARHAVLEKEAADRSKEHKAAKEKKAKEEAAKAAAPVSQAV